MGRKRTGWTREKDGTFYVGLTLRSGKPYEKPVPAPPDGLPIDDNYLALVRSKLVRAYESGAWDPEAPEEPVATAPENPTFAEHLRRFTDSRTYESAEKDRRRVKVYLAASPVAATANPPCSLTAKGAKGTSRRRSRSTPATRRSTRSCTSWT